VARLKRKLRPEETRDPLEAMIADLSVYSWQARAAELIDKNIVDVNAIREVEKRKMLSEDQDEHFYSAFDPQNNWTYVCKQHASKELAQSFELAARWHRWRSRAQLALRYEQRAFRCNEILSELEASHHERPNKASA
jgi:hypothetical protein